MPRRIYWFLALTVVCACTVFAISSEPLPLALTEKPKRILLVYSYEEAYFLPFSVSFMREMRQRPFACDYTLVKLQMQKGGNSAVAEKTFDEILPDIKAGKFDVVVAVHEPAYTQFYQHAAELPAKLPVIFVRVAGYKGIPAAHRNMTGTTMHLSPGSAADLAYQLFPDRLHLILVTCKDDVGLLVEQRLRLYVKANNKFALTVLHGEDMNESETLAAIAKAREGSVVLYLNWFDPVKKQVDIDKTFLGRLAVWENVPIIKLSGVEDLEQYGAIGAVLPGRTYDYGIDTARRVERVLTGTPAASLPVTELPLSTVINYELLDSWGVHPDSLPRDAILLGKKESVWSLYEREILLIGSLVFLLLAGAATISLVFLAQRRTALRQLQKSQVDLENSYRMVNIVLDNVSVPIWLYDGTGNQIHVNREVCKIFKIPATQISKSGPSEIIGKNLNAPIQLPVQEVINCGASVRREVNYDGREYVVAAEPVFDETHQLRYVVKSAADITDLNSALQAAQAADRAKSYFLASMSHEIRTPLNAVIGFAELLRDGDVAPETRRDYLDSIGSSANALMQLLDDVLDLSRLEAQQLEIVPVKMDVVALCKSVMAIFLPEARRKGISLTVKAASLPALYLDERRLRQIFWNIIGNAVKFTERGGVAVSVDFLPVLQSKTGTFVFMADDTGAGIPAEDIEKISQPFVQLTHLRGTNSGKSGTGLGLAVTRRMAEKMGGRLTLESVVGQGSRVGIVLSNVHFEPGTLAAKKSVATAAPAALNRKTVLLVDDVPLNLKVLSARLAKFGMSAMTASSGAEALAKLRERQVDLILTDLWMPVMNGEQFARAIRAEWKERKAKIIAVTADTDAASNFDMGVFDGAVQKPVTQNQLQEILEKHCGPEGV